MDVLHSDGRLLAIHCDWEHWRRHATRFPSGHARGRRASLPFVLDNRNEAFPWSYSDRDVDEDSVDSGRESLTSPYASWNEAKRPSGGPQCADEAVFSPTSCKFPSVSSSGCGTEEDGRNDTDTPLGINYQHWTLPVPEAVFTITDPTEPSHGDEHDKEKKQPLCSHRQQVGATGFAPFERLLELIMNGLRMEVPVLHRAGSNKKMLQCLADPRVDVNKMLRYDRPMHAFIRKQLRERVEMITNLITSGRGADINLSNGDGNTPLHLAAELSDSKCIKVLLAFGADTSACNFHNRTPIQVVTHDDVRAMRGLNPTEVKKVPERRETHRSESSGKSRILILDGGGIRGLAQIEMLMEIERRTGRRVVEMFDWIVGTSTGGIIALGLVYAKKTLSEIRDMYFQSKDCVFTGVLNIVQNTWAMSMLAKKWFGAHQRMSSVRHPKVLISAVDLSTTKLPVVFFNNFDDQNKEKSHLLRAHVWEVARATSAAPSVFKSLNGRYVDGGVKANNPSMFAMKEIREYHLRKGGAMPRLSLVVSVGTGIAPAKDKVSFEGGTWEILTIKRLLSFLRKAMSDSEEVARMFDVDCKLHNIPYYRLNPELSESIEMTETKTSKLVNMLYETRCYLCDQEGKVLRQIAEAFDNLQPVTV